MWLLIASWSNMNIGNVIFKIIKYIVVPDRCYIKAKI